MILQLNVFIFVSSGSKQPPFNKKSNMNHIGLFEGGGGFSLAAEWIGWPTIAWCEYNPYAQKHLNKHFTDAKQHGDITTTDFNIYRGQ